MTNAIGKTAVIGNISLTVVDDILIPHRVEAFGGIVIGRVQKILNNITGEITTVNFWYENGKLHHVA